MTDWAEEKALEIQESARRCVDTLGVPPKGGWYVDAIAAALREERERCARIAEKWNYTNLETSESIPTDDDLCRMQTASDIAAEIRGLTIEEEE